MPQTRLRIKKGGTNFRNAVVTTPLCCPSRASIFTGRFAHNHRVLTEQASDLVQESTLQYYLQRAGYRTALFGKYLNGWDRSQSPPYFDRFAFTGTGRYRNATWNVNGNLKTITDYNTSFISRKARRFIRHTSEKQAPWFLYLATAAPHRPFRPQQKYANTPVTPWDGDPAVFEADRSDKPAYIQARESDFSQGARVRQAQFRTLMSVDRLVARVFNTLSDLGGASNTLVFFISDNGMMWGEHGFTGKGVPYEQSISVPLLVRWPGHFLEGATDDRTVANIDIAPTVLEATGISPDPAYPMDGRSLLGTSSLRRRLLTEYFTGTTDKPQGNWASTRNESYNYTEYYADDGTTITFREYYDLERDPWELDNLLGDSDPSNDPDVAALHLQLARDRECRGTVGVNACP
jgi:arylsulfatase A-like enzyme